jgi:Protein of unknown function (DUF1579)
MADQAQLPTPHPALRRLDRLVGRWSMEGHLVGSDETNIHGTTTFQWLPCGFFLEQHVELDFMGITIDSLELGYDPETETFPSTVFSNVSPVPLPYFWEVDGDTIKISVSYGPLEALRRRLASQPRRRRDGQCPLRHRRTPAELIPWISASRRSVGTPRDDP